MVEPTESEDLTELNRFIDAMKQIALEINEIRDGRINHEESALHHAPHTAATLLSGDWNRPYSREKAAGISSASDQHLMAKRGKYWPTVGRIDGVYGDRNLVCACPPIESYA